MWAVAVEVRGNSYKVRMFDKPIPWADWIGGKSALAGDEPARYEYWRKQCQE
jgi:hypothetical protein